MNKSLLIELIDESNEFSEIHESKHLKVIEHIFCELNDMCELNDEIFLKQYKNFMELDKQSIYEPNFYLNFYIKCVKLLREKHEVNLSQFITQAISSNIFHKFSNNYYELLYHSSTEEPPESDRFVIITRRSTSDDNPQLSGFDLSSVINPQYIRDLKDYIWYSDDDFSKKHAIVYC